MIWAWIFLFLIVKEQTKEQIAVLEMNCLREYLSAARNEPTRREELPLGSIQGKCLTQQVVVFALPSGLPYRGENRTGLLQGRQVNKQKQSVPAL
jgi:hypothetical protein